MRKTISRPDSPIEQLPRVTIPGGKTLTVLSLLLLSGTQQWAASPSMQQMVVTVVNKHFDPAQPVPNVRVSLSYFDGSQKITDARERTNRKGQTELSVSPEAHERGDLRIEIFDAEGLVVYQPSEGIVRAVTPAMTVVLLPKGSPALLEPVRIEAMLDRLSRISAQNQRLKVSVSKLESQKPDFDVALREWATSNGLPYDEVNERVHAWASDVLAHRNEASLTRQAEAELGLRHFERAAILFQGAANNTKLALHGEQAGYLARRRAELRTLIKESQQSAVAYQLAHNFEKSTESVDGASREATVEHQRYPEDAALRDIWLWGSILAEAVRWKEALNVLTQSTSMDRSLQLFGRVTSDCRDLLQQIDKAAEPDKWAYTDSLVAITLISLSEISSSRQADDFRTQAIAAARSVLEVYDRKGDPKGWANFELLLGSILAAQAARGISDAGITFDQANPLLVQAVTAFRAALEVYSRTETPKEWASTQSALANAISMQGLLAQGNRFTELMTQAEAATRAALAVYTKTEYPDDWADTEDSLAQVLCSRAEVAPDNQSHDLFAEAVAAERAALELRNKQEDPRKWANTQDGLGIVLEKQASRTAGDEAVRLLAQSVAAFRAELEVITKSGFPQKWARIQTNVGESLAMQGIRVTGIQSTELLEQAAAAYGKALQVFTKDEYPTRRARVLLSLGPLYHEYLTDFAKAYEITLSAQTENPGDENRLNLAEAELTTSRFSECSALLNSTDDAQMQSGLVPARRVLLLACQWGSKQAKSAAQTADSLARYATEIPKSGWTTIGDRKYLAEAPEFEPGRPLWIKLFQALQDTDAPSLAEASHALHDLIGN